MKTQIKDSNNFIFKEGYPTDFISLSMGCKYNKDLNWDNEYNKRFLKYIYSLQLKKKMLNIFIKSFGFLFMR